MRRSSIKDIINTSLWETVRRSLATTIITLLPVGALFLFGGAVLQDFAFAILIGISISAFSTIFIAAPFLAVLLERSPEYKSRAARPERRGAEEPEPGEKLVPVGAGAPVDGDGQVPAPATPVASPPPAGSKRDRRRQRRRARPHGRAR
jgi:Protein export membrane protein